MDQPDATRPQSKAEGSPSEEELSAVTSSEARKATAPPLVPDYDLLRRIGHGAYGDVWLARSKATGVLRAAKIVWRHTFEDERPFKREFEGIQRFERISREHPGQLALFHIGRNEAEGYFYYVMELADDAAALRGENRRLQRENGKDTEHIPRHPPSTSFDPQHYTPRTLRADLEHGRLPAERVLEIGLVLSEALGHLHGNGLVHRDVKPSNMIFVNGRPKLADIGLVTDASDQCSIVGTEGYLPPEGPGTPQADIFALGKVLYETATGMDRRQFPKLPEDLRNWPDATLVFELNEVILKACAQEARQRYTTCDEMLTELALLDQGKSIKRKRTRQQQSSVAKKVFATAAAFGVIAFGANLLWRQPPATRPGSTNLQARTFYNQAIQDLQSRSPGGGQRAYTNLTEAVKADPRFLDAYYLIFESEFHGAKVPGGNYRIAKNLQGLAPDSAQYHIVNSKFMFDEGMFEDAINEAKRAIEKNPHLMREHGLYGWYLALAHGDAEAALQEYESAEQIGPPDRIIETIKAGAYCMEHKFDQAIKQLNNAIQLDPKAPEPHKRLSEVYEADKQYDKAIDEHEAWKLLSPEDDPTFTKNWHQKMHSILHEKGPRGWWQAQLDGQKKHSYVDPYWMAQINARLGNTNEVNSQLARAYEEHNGQMINLLEDDHWDEYRSYQWFKDLLVNVRLHPISGAVR